MNVWWSWTLGIKNSIKAQQYCYWITCFVDDNSSSNIILIIHTEYKKSFKEICNVIAWGNYFCKKNLFLVLILTKCNSLEVMLNGRFLSQIHELLNDWLCLIFWVNFMQFLVNNKYVEKQVQFWYNFCLT